MKHRLYEPVFHASYRLCLHSPLMPRGALQVKVLKEMRQATNESAEMNESFAATVQGIGIGMGWTG